MSWNLSSTPGLRKRIAEKLKTINTGDLLKNTWTGEFYLVADIVFYKDNPTDGVEGRGTVICLNSNTKAEISVYQSWLLDVEVFPV